MTIFTHITCDTKAEANQRWARPPVRERCFLGRSGAAQRAGGGTRASPPPSVQLMSRGLTSMNAAGSVSTTMTFTSSTGLGWATTPSCGHARVHSRPCRTRKHAHPLHADAAHAKRTKRRKPHCNVRSRPRFQPASSSRGEDNNGGYALSLG